MDFIQSQFSNFLGLNKILPLLYAVGLPTFCFYLILVRCLRYRHISYIRQKYPDATITLRDSDVAAEVFDYTTRKDFPFLSGMGLEIAFFKTYTIPSISKLLHATKQSSKYASKRTEDAELLMMEASNVYPHLQIELKKNPRLSKEEIDEIKSRRQAAIQRINEMHGAYNILNSDYLYTLSLFVVEPIKWIDRYGWRELEPIEKNAIFRIWSDIGSEMKIKGIPNTLEDMFEFQETYARDHVSYAPSNWKVGLPTLEHLLTRFPKLVRPIIQKVLAALLGEFFVTAFGLEPPTAFMSNMVDASLKLANFSIRHLMLPRYTSIVRTPSIPDRKTGLLKPNFDLYKPIYPRGYCIYELGPHKFKPSKCPIKHL